MTDPHLRRTNERWKKYEKDGELTERERWLQNNPEAKAMVQEGLQDCKDGRISDMTPDLEADEKLITELSDRDMERLAEILEDDSEPNEALKQAAEEYKEQIKDAE